jgi:NADH-ubiquinone oxidoreductase chain 5
MYLLILIMPIFGAALAGFTGRILGRKGSILITTVFILLMNILVMTCYLEVAI